MNRPAKLHPAEALEPWQILALEQEAASPALTRIRQSYRDKGCRALTHAELIEIATDGKPFGHSVDEIVREAVL